VRIRCQAGDQPGGRGGGHGVARAGGQGVVGADRQHIAHAELADAAAQLPAAIHLIADGEGGADPGRVRAVQQLTGQLRLGGEQHFAGDAGQLAVLLIGGAPLRQVQRPVDQRVAAAGGKGQGDGHLAQRDTAQGAAVLAGRPGRITRGLLIRGLIHDQHRIPVIEVTDRPRRRRIQHLPLIPHSAREQVLQPVRPAMPGRLGNRPAVVVLQLHQQPRHHLAAGLAGLPPRETPRHPAQQVIQQPRVNIVSYRGSSGCRVMVVPHNRS
jgi:hypothetical protein